MREFDLILAIINDQFLYSQYQDRDCSSWETKESKVQLSHITSLVNTISNSRFYFLVEVNKSVIQLLQTTGVTVLHNILE